MEKELEFQPSNYRLTWLLLLVAVNLLTKITRGRFDNPNSQANLQRNGRMPGALNIYTVDLCLTSQSFYDYEELISSTNYREITHKNK